MEKISTPEAIAPKLEVDTSVMNLLDKSTFLSAFSTGALINTVKESGYRGIEWYPLRTPSGLLISHGLVGQDVKDAIVSLHQSYRSEKSLKKALEHPNQPLALLSYVLLPERIASLDDLEHLQKVLGKKMPVVLYPSLPGEESGTERDFGEKLFQPYTEIMVKWRVKTVEELITETKKRGYTGFALDLFHMRRPTQDDRGINLLDPWEESLPQLLPYTKEVHISAGRTDLFYLRGIPETENELDDLLGGQGNTELMKMLKVIKRSGWKGRVVTEIPASALHQLAIARGQSTSAKNLIQDHRKIVENIQDILG